MDLQLRSILKESDNVNILRLTLVSEWVGDWVSQWASEAKVAS